MVCRRFIGILLILVIAGIVSASIPLTVDSGQVMLKKTADAAWKVIDSSSQIETGDSLMVGETLEAKCSLFKSVKLFLKDSCKFVINANENKASIILISGQIFLNKDIAVEDITVEIKAKNCIFTPVGTAAAVKFIKKSDPSVAVLTGTIRMTKPDGAAQDVGAGMYCTYDVAANTFIPVKQLPPNAIAALESWSGVKHGEPTPPSSEEVTEEEAAPTPEAGIAAPVVAETPAVPEEKVETPPAEEVAEEQVKEPEPVEEKKEAAAPAQPTAVTPSPEEEGKKPDEEVPEKEAEKEKEEKAEEGPAKPEWEISAAMVTVDNEQWTRIAVAVDVPIWRFGVCFDLELFLDAQGDFSNKGWNFDSPRDAAESMLRKIRYIRFNHLGDPVFIKLGGLDNVTFGYGFIVDRFTNLLHYPGEKLFGLQFDLNDISPIGITMQTLIPDFKDFADDGGILAARLAFKPFKMTEKPIIGGLSIGATIASDLNQYAPAQKWDYSLNGERWDKDEDGVTDSTYLFNTYNEESYYDELVRDHKNAGDYDREVAHKDQWAKDTTDPATIVGGDIVIPIISSKVLSIDLYAQTGVLLDDENDDELYKGWGIGAPGVGVKVGPVWGQIEFRHIEDLFVPGYFGTYYLDERIRRNPITIKEGTLEISDLNGVFGLVGFNILNMFIFESRYQLLLSEEDASGERDKDQRFEATASLGDILLERIPKINKVAVFYYQSDIDNDYEYKQFFYQTPNTYWGYRLGCEVLAGASIIWETRYGWKWNKERTKLEDDKTVTIKAALTF